MWNLLKILSNATDGSSKVDFNWVHSEFNILESFIVLSIQTGSLSD